MRRNQGKNPAIRVEPRQMMMRGRSSSGGGVLPSSPSPAPARARAREDHAVAEREGEESPPSSCISWEEGERSSSAKNDDSSPPPPSMVLAGCPHCLMYVMLSGRDPTRCPRCSSALLLDFAAAAASSKSTARNV